MINAAADLIAPLYELAVDAGEAIMEIYRGGDLGVEAKADESPLTRADRAAHSRVVAGLSRMSPDIPIVSEEGRHADFDERAGWNELWLVDPLDGTKEFIAGRSEFTVNIALIQLGVPVLGVIYAPALAEGFAGVAPWSAGYVVPGEQIPSGDTGNHGPAFYHAPPGSSLELVRSAATAALNPGPLRVVASRSHLNRATTAYIDSLERRVAPRVLERVSYGSSLKLCRLADGSAHIYPRFGPTMEWDTAAADAVLRAAGGECRAANGECLAADGPLRYNKPDLHNPHFVACVPAARDLVIE